MKAEVEMKSVHLFFAVVLAAMALGCETTDEPTKVPVAGGGGVGVGDLSGTPKPGQQWTVQDAGSSAGIGQNRPKMSYAAGAIFQQGMQAFVAGDLPNAKKFSTGVFGYGETSALHPLFSGHRDS